MLCRSKIMLTLKENELWRCGVWNLTLSNQCESAPMDQRE